MDAQSQSAEIRPGRRAEEIPHSGIREIFNAAQSIKDYVNFGLGEPDFDTPAVIVEAAANAARNGHTHYTVNAGLPELRERIADSLAEEQGLAYDPKNSVIVTAGGMGGLFLALEAAVDPGDEVLVPEPFWPNYISQVMLTGATPVRVALSAQEGFTVTADRLAAAVTPRTRALILNSPSNPTGAVLTAGELQRIAELARRESLIIISDEVYEKLVWAEPGHTSIATMAGAWERTIGIHSFSKSYAMTGWRVGYAAGPASLIGPMVKLQESIYACASTVGQYGALAALTQARDAVEAMQTEYRRRRRVALDRIDQLPGVSAIEPAGGFYIFLDVRETGLSSRDFAFGLLKQHGLAVVPGSAFGAAGEGFVRVSYATNEARLHEGFDRMAAFLDSRG